MKEQDLIDENCRPATFKTLVEELTALGIKPGDTVLVHSSLSAIGWICGGAVAVIQALEKVLGENGTMVMPAQTGEYSHPALWSNPAVPPRWWLTIMEEMPAFEPEITPTRNMGKIAETFRTMPGTLRSHHPQCSFSAKGKHAREIVENHDLDYPTGNNSPLAKLYDLDARVLLIGVGYDRNTSFHLAEARIEGLASIWQGTCIMENGVRTWRRFWDLENMSDYFEQIGERFEKNCNIAKSALGKCQARLFSLRDSVDYACEELAEIISSKPAQAPEDRALILVEADEGFSMLYEQEAEFLGNLFNENLLALHHIGSSSIKGLRAKPIVDILAIVENIQTIQEHRNSLEVANYQWWGEYGIPGRLFFKKLDDNKGKTLVHMHLFQKGDTNIEHHLKFRNLLAENPEAREIYERAKLELSSIFPESRNLYSIHKGRVVEYLLNCKIP